MTDPIKGQHIDVVIIDDPYDQDLDNEWRRKWAEERESFEAQRAALRLRWPVGLKEYDPDWDGLVPDGMFEMLAAVQARAAECLEGMGEAAQRLAEVLRSSFPTTWTDLDAVLRPFKSSPYNNWKWTDLDRLYILISMGRISEETMRPPEAIALFPMDAKTRKSVRDVMVPLYVPPDPAKDPTIKAALDKLVRGPEVDAVYPAPRKHKAKDFDHRGGRKRWRP